MEELMGIRRQYTYLLFLITVGRGEGAVIVEACCD